MSAPLQRYRGAYLGLAERDGWEYATRTNARAVAVLIPVTDDDRVVLVEQHRIPVQARVLELPAGLVGDGDDAEERIAEAAQRELLEETGYRAGRLRRLLDCPSTAGLSDEMITFFLAEELTREGPGGGDASEDIEVHEVPLGSVDSWLAERLAAGVMLDPKIYAALYWLADRRRFENLPGAPATA